MASLSGLKKLVVDELRIRRPHSTGPRENIFDIILDWVVLNYDKLEQDIQTWMLQNPSAFQGIPGAVGHTGAPAIGIESFLARLTALEQQVSILEGKNG
jgi:hypothetical protein